MKILYFYQYFSTPKGSWGTRVYDFASEWTKKGHEVTVVTSIYSKSDLKSNKIVDTKYFNGIKVIILNIDVNNKQAKFLRIFSFLKYALFSSYYALFTSTDIVISSSGPITAGVPGLIAKFIRRKKFVFEVRDLWPLGAIELGYLKNRWLIKFCLFFERLCYKTADLIVALSPGMARHIEEKSNHKNVISITNAADIDLFSNTKKLNDKFIKFKKLKYAIYCGNIGEVNNSIWLYNAAVFLSKNHREDIKILIVGDGPQKKYLQNKAENDNLKTIIFMDLIPKEDLVSLIQNSFVSLVPLKDLKILETSSPNKFFESLAAGVPIIQNTRGWMCDFIHRHNLGYTIDSNRADILALKLIEMADSTHNESARIVSIARKYFDKKLLALEMLNNFKNIK